MQDLTGRYPAALAPTSQEAGGMVTHPDHLKGLPIAPGSEPVTPVPSPDEGSQPPKPDLPAVQLPVSSAPGTPAVTRIITPSRWTAAGSTAGTWKETP
jgi:hypothetical protein